MQSHTTNIHSYLKTSVLISYYNRCSNWWPCCSFLSFFFHSSYILFYTFMSNHDCTPLQVFYKGSIQSNQQLALSRLTHSIQCDSTWKKTSTRTSLCCMRLHNIKNSRHWTFTLYTRPINTKASLFTLITHTKRKNIYILSRIWGSHSGEYEDGFLLGYSLPTFQRSLLPPASGQWVSRARGIGLRYRNQSPKADRTSGE
jgi:hypothetical protein